MSGTQLTISCPRCNFRQNLPAETIVDGPISQTCPSCGLLFRVGHSLSDSFPSDPTFETDDGWYVRKDGEEVLYFPNLEILRRWAQEGHVSASDEISKKGKSWRPIYELPEFASMMVWKNETEKEPRTPTHELEQVSEDMIEVEEFSSESKSNKSIIFVIAAAILLGALATLFLGTIEPQQKESTSPSPAPALATETTKAETKATKSPEPQDTSSSAQIVEGKDASESKTAAVDAKTTKPKRSTKKKARNNESRKRKATSKKSNTKSYDSLMELGAKQLRSKQTAPLAVQTFMAAMRFPEATSEARAKLGRAFLMVGDTKSAIKHLEKARKTNPGYRPALWDLARAYQRIQNKDKAISVFRSLANLLDPESRQGHQVARELERMGVSP